MTVPTLSVLMMNFNHARFIPDALDAVLAQSHCPLEILVLDDGSTDNSAQVIERYQQLQPRLIRLLRHEKNRGGLHSAGRLLMEARGDFVFFGAMDDRVSAGLFEASLSQLAQHPKAGVCSSLSSLLSPSGQSLGPYRTPVVLRQAGYLAPALVRRRLWQVGNWFTGNTTLYRRTGLIEMGGFPVTLNAYADSFVAQVLALRDGACFVPEVLGEWRRLEGGHSSTYGRDAAVQEAVRVEAVRLMSTEYSHLFPRLFVSLWSNEMKLAIGKSRLLAAQQSANTGFLSKTRFKISTMGLHFKHFPWFALNRRLTAVLAPAAYSRTGST